eukprot:scaffold15247_cov128-Isochrysis_galbana.AAC.2
MRRDCSGAEAARRLRCAGAVSATIRHSPCRPDGLTSDALRLLFLCSTAGAERECWSAHWSRRPLRSSPESSRGARAAGPWWKSTCAQPPGSPSPGSGFGPLVSAGQTSSP